MTVYRDNPAGRLHELVTEFRSKAGQRPISHAWAAVLGIPDVNSPDLLRRLAHVFRLPAEIEAEIQQVDNREYDSDLALRWQVNIPGQLGPVLFTGNQSGQIATRFDDASLYSLEYCNVTLHRHCPQRVFSDSQLDGIRELISELGAEVDRTPGLDPSLRDFMLSHAVAMLRALEDLAVRGPVALEEAFDQAVGAAYRRKDLTVKKESDSGVWTKFQNLIIAVSAVLQIATSSFVLPSQIRQELEGPPPPQPPVVKIIEVPAKSAPFTPDVQPGDGRVAKSSGSS